MRCLAFRRLNYFVSKYSFRHAPQAGIVLYSTLQGEEPNVARYTGNVVVIDSANDPLHDQSLSEYFKSDIIGFDLEYVPDYYSAIRKSSTELKRPSVIQLCGSDVCLLYLIYKIGRIPSNLAAILTDQLLIKVAHGAPSDMRLLHAHHGIAGSGFVDLQELCRKEALLPCNLKNACLKVLNLKLSKREQCSNWEAEQLTKSQLEYAATDAFITREIFLKMAPKHISKLFINSNGDVEAIE
ncbi:bifunctional Ribonuclease H-like superfamily/3'-5' exonuclease domain/Ribonuclease H superfamily [Babesia duncani]|uniref:Bifunctional Ribonuclease H-like superfamily/3'-5' exonuclease domain/Ribonuclease H superfamily n=1 Tax=Babesia duncani TaxID=323732 RepID=A0AAD9UN21_9APIC|nr:bifunctional Ribonuclease H-like superfamily/3'-5' exonuclease domain/Ribonuclease H superfamily [Babesia duncani]